MKFYLKLFIILTVFFSLIAYCSFSFATDIDPTHETIDTSVVGWSLGIIDASECYQQSNGSSASLDGYTSCLLRISSGKLRCYFTTGKFYYNSNDNTIYATTGFTGFTLNSNGSVSGNISGDSNFPVADEYTSSQKITSNAIYSDSSLESYLEMNNVVSNDVTFFSGSFNKVVGMVNVVNGLATDLSVDNLFEIVSYAIPLIVIIVLFVFGYFIVRKMNKGISKGKERI